MQKGQKMLQECALFLPFLKENERNMHANVDEDRKRLAKWYNDSNSPLFHYILNYLILYVQKTACVQKYREQ